MKKPLLLTSAFLTIATTMTHAALPLWTFTPLTPTTITLSSSGTATVQYLVTNNSKRPHILMLQNTAGISQRTTPGNCPNPFSLRYQESCTLTLDISGALLQGNVLSGPVVCQDGNYLQCYQPSREYALNITRNVTATITGSSNNPAVLYGTNMNWLGSSPSQYIVFYCAGNGCDINSSSETPTGPITSTSMETDPDTWAGYSVAICSASDVSYNPETCSNIYYTPP
jgi:hypothetical protein